MPININTIKQDEKLLGKSGHATFWAMAEYTGNNHVDPQQSVNKGNSNAVLKLNKHGKPALSELEVGISAVWEACLQNQTPQCDLVIGEKGQTIGVLSKKLKDFSPMNDKAETIQTLEKFQKEELARILVMCYCLEEDDLHRNNIGFYTDDQGKKHMAKIDHDMSFYESISSVSGS